MAVGLLNGVLVAAVAYGVGSWTLAEGEAKIAVEAAVETILSAASNVSLKLTMNGTYS